MSSFTPRLLSPAAAEPDPTKHVNYNLGMVLGVDDFTQEFAYLAGRDQWLARDLLGYGTVSGLRVGVEVESSGPQVSVTPGVALSPGGRLIRVAPAQCAGLNAWLAAHHAELLSLLGSPADDRASLRLFVVLGYRECPTDMIPIPGQPCRSEDEATAPSRLADDFALELRLSAPDQQEEDALRDFVAWLSQIEITDEPDGMLGVEEFVEAIRAAAYLDSSPPPASPPDFMYGSPPAALRIHASLAYEYLRAAFRVWVTELRPRWQPRWVGKGQGCNGADGAAGGGDDCLLLAELNVRLVRTGPGANWLVEDSEAVVVQEERRPYLMHLRMVQEWLLGRRYTAEGEPLLSSSALVPAFTVEAETTHGQPAQVGTSLDYARADHTHGTPPPPALAGDVTGSTDATSVERLRGREVAAEPPDHGSVLTFDAEANTWLAAQPAQPANRVEPERTYGQDAAVGTSLAYARADHTHGTPPPPVLVGDVSGLVSNTTVGALLGINLNPTRPTEGQVLAYDSLRNRWGATTLPEATPAPAPADTVTNEITFGQAANAGTSADYSRADHTHGTPPAPALAGDVTGAAGATVVGALRGVNVSQTLPTNGQVLTFDAAQNRWGGATPSAGPAAATTVASSQTFGQTAVVGTSAAYARADHRHGTPALPVPGGDATGSIAAMTVTGLRGRQVAVTAPTAGDVLTFDAALNAWRPAPPPSAAAGDFVQHPAGLPPYLIVAAGIVRGDDPNTSTMTPDRYNNLRIRRLETGRIVVTFDGYSDPAAKNIQYIVKAMAVTTKATEGIVVNFEQFFVTADLGFSLLVTGNGQPVELERLMQMSFMIEVSQYDFTSRLPRG